MEWQDAMAYGATCDGEYCVVESSALPLYLQHVFGEKHELFQMVTMPLALLEGVLDCIHLFLGSATQETSMEALFEQYCLRELEKEKVSRRKKTVQALTAVWEQLLECDVCVLPSVLLMSKKHTANEWSDGNAHRRATNRLNKRLGLLLTCRLLAARRLSCRYERLKLLEQEAKLTVFPFIDVESKMENKVRTRATKKQCGSVQVDGR